MSTTTAVRHRQVSVGNSSIHVAEIGPVDGRPVLFLHGWPQSWRSWQPVMEQAAGADGGTRALAIDLPGIGGSSGDGTGGSKRELARLVHDLVGVLDLADLVLVGHDAGGMITYAYLRQYDDLAGAVILDTVIPGVDPWDAVVRNPYIWHFAFHAQAGLPELLVEGHQGEYFDYFFDILSVEPNAISVTVRSEYADAYRSPSALTAGFDLYRALNQDAQDNLAFSRADPAATPLLYVRGAGEMGDIDAYAKGFGDAGIIDVTTALVPDAGHFAPEENPAEVWRCVRAFIGV